MTAVEWLINELQLYYEGQSKLVYYEIIEQAKQMEKEQIIDAYDYGSNASLGVSKDSLINETYKNKI